MSARLDSIAQGWLGRRICKLDWFLSITEPMLSGIVD